MKMKQKVASEATTERLADEAVTGTVVAPSEGVIQTPIVGDVAFFRREWPSLPGRSYGTRHRGWNLVKIFTHQLMLKWQIASRLWFETANGAEILIHVVRHCFNEWWRIWTKKLFADKVSFGDVLGTFDSAKIAMQVR